MHLCTLCGVLILLDEADRCSALAIHLQSLMRAAATCRSSTSSLKLEDASADGAERDWSDMMDSESKRFRFSASPLSNGWAEPCRLTDRRFGNRQGFRLPARPAIGGHVRKKTAFSERGCCAESSGLSNPYLLLADETNDTQLAGVGEVLCKN